MSNSSMAEGQLESILLCTRAGTWIWDVPSGSLSVNARWAEILGHSLHEVAPVTIQTWRARMHPEDAPACEALLVRHFQALDPYVECELRMRQASGAWTWVQVHGKVVARDAQGAPTRVSGIMMDIAARKRAEMAREELFARLQQLAATVPGFLYQFRLRADGSAHFPYASAGIREVYGCTPEDVLDDASPVFTVLHPDDLDRTVRTIHASARALSPWHDLYRVRHPVHGERWVEGNAVPTGHEDGSITWHGHLRDVTHAQRDQQQLRLAASVFTASQEGILITDAARRIIDVNPAFTRITGYTREEAIGQSPRLLSSGRHDPAFFDALGATLAREGQWHGEIWNRRKSGEVYVQLLSIVAVRDETGAVLHHVAVFTDIDRLKRQELALERIAHYDPLTELPNRRLLDNMLRAELSRTRRNARVLAVAYLDLDGFKAVNDQHGREVGDALLCAAGVAIRGALRVHDTLARLGGDEFGILLTDLHDGNDSITVIERVLAVIARPIEAAGVSVCVSASIGVTLFPDDDADGDTLLRHADQAMLAAKQAGRNRFQIFDALEDRRVRGVQALLLQIERGLHKGEFRLFYQPKVDLRDGRVIGLEALIRWQHPSEGLLAPGHFLPALQRSRLDRLVGEWVIAEAVRQCIAWGALGLDLSLSVNVSGQHLLHPDFVPYLEQVFAAHPAMDPRHLELEILESTELDDLDQIAATLTRADGLGVQFALDDFGTGYSSLTTLRRLPVQTIKIDQSFVRGMLDQPDDIAIVEGVLAMARSFKREVVAEGVETDAHSECLRRLGCHCVQGYGIARPMPAEAVPAWIEGWRARYAAGAVVSGAGAPRQAADSALRSTA